MAVLASPIFMRKQTNAAGVCLAPLTPDMEEPWIGGEDGDDVTTGNLNVMKMSMSMCMKIFPFLRALSIHQHTNLVQIRLL
jgi:hypothetical protein